MTAQAWHLFAIFFATILSVVIGAFPILTASVLALAAAVLSGTLSAEAAYAGFSNPTIILIVIAFLVARAVVTCGSANAWAIARSVCSGDRRWDSRYSIVGRGRLDRASVSQQHGSLRCAVPAHVLARPGRRGNTRSRGPAPARKVSDVLGNGEPHALIRVVADRDGWATRWEPRWRASSGSRSGSDPGCIAASVPTLLCMALLPFLYYRLIKPEVADDAECARRGAPGARQAGPADPRSEGRDGDVRRDGRALGS